MLESTSEMDLGVGLESQVSDQFSKYTSTLPSQNVVTQLFSAFTGPKLKSPFLLQGFSVDKISMAF